MRLHSLRSPITTQSLPDTRPRSFLTSLLADLPSNRLCLEPYVGLVALRGLGGTATLSTRACKREMASARLYSRLRLPCALMTTTPSDVMRWSLRANRRALMTSGKEDAVMSKRKRTAFDTLLTFCPPAPCARMAL